MKRRKRWRRFAMWAGLAACVGLCAYSIATAWIFARLTAEQSFALWLWRGRIELWVFDKDTDPLIKSWGWGAPGQVELYSYRALELPGLDLIIAEEPGRGLTDALGGWPELSRTKSQFLCITAPSWLLLMTAAIPTFLLWRAERRDRRRDAGACSGCGYDLTGNVTGRCPECGADAAR